METPRGSRVRLEHTPKIMLTVGWAMVTLGMVACSFCVEGWGLGPIPFPPGHTIYYNIYINKAIYLTRSNVGWVRRPDLAKSLSWWEVSCSIMVETNFFPKPRTSKRVARGSLGLCHVAQLHLSITETRVSRPMVHLFTTSNALSVDRTLPHVTVRTCHMSSYGRVMCHYCKGDTCHSLIGPMYMSMSGSVRPVILPCVISKSCQLFLPRQLYGRATCTIIYDVALYRLYGLYNHHLFCLFGKLNRSP